MARQADRIRITHDARAANEKWRDI
jgi:hypothetical protein